MLHIIVILTWFKLWLKFLDHTYPLKSFKFIYLREKSALKPESESQVSSFMPWGSATELLQYKRQREGFVSGLFSGTAPACEAVELLFRSRLSFNFFHLIVFKYLFNLYYHKNKLMSLQNWQLIKIMIQYKKWKKASFITNTKNKWRNGDKMHISKLKQENPWG